jgi:hypothetical protein
LVVVVVDVVAPGAGVSVEPVAVFVVVDVVVVVWVVVSVPGALVPVDVVVDVVSVLPPQAANEATIAKLAAARAMVFMFNVIKLNRLLLACFVSVEHCVECGATSNFCQPGTAAIIQLFESESNYLECIGKVHVMRKNRNINAALAHAPVDHQCVCVFKLCFRKSRGISAETRTFQSYQQVCPTP